MLSDLEKCEGTEKVKVIDSFMPDSLLTNGTKSESIILFTAYDQKNKPYQFFNDDMSDFLREVPPLRDGEVYVPAAMKNMYSCEKGDTISLTVMDQTNDFSIAGFMEEPFTGCDVINIMNLVITPNDFNHLYNNSISTDNAAQVSKISPVRAISGDIKDLCDRAHIFLFLVS